MQGQWPPPNYLLSSRVCVYQGLTDIVSALLEGQLGPLLLTWPTSLLSVHPPDSLSGPEATVCVLIWFCPLVSVTDYIFALYPDSLVV